MVKQMKSIFIITILSMIFLLSCNETDKQKKELVLNIMKNPENIDSLVKASIFYDEELFNMLFIERPIDTQGKIDYINKYKKFGFYFVGDKKIDSFRFNVKFRRIFALHINWI
jgi:hypothetical protein